MFQCTITHCCLRHDSFLSNGVFLQFYLENKLDPPKRMQGNLIGAKSMVYFLIYFMLVIDDYSI